LCGKYRTLKNSKTPLDKGACNFVILSQNPIKMKKPLSPQPSPLSVLLKSLAAVFNSFFQSSSNREFKRLKDFIAS
jgi:hypothetical protein